MYMYMYLYTVIRITYLSPRLVKKCLRILGRLLHVHVHVSQHLECSSFSGEVYNFC